MTAEEKRKEFYKENLKLRKNQRLTCCDCKNQTFILVFGCTDFPFYDCICSKCGSIRNHVRI